MTTKTVAEEPKAPEAEAGIQTECEGRFKIAAHAGGGEKIGVFAGGPHPSRGAETADPIRAERD